MQSPDADSTALSRHQYAKLHPKGIDRHYWHQARLGIVWRGLQNVLRPTSTVLDVGCGPGIIVNFLRKKGVNCLGVDLGAPDPQCEEEGVLFLGQSAFDLTEDVRLAIDVLLIMDVLEHLPDAASFLDQCWQAFPNAEHVYVTLPARNEIWSDWDEFNGHYRRYTTTSLEQLVQRSRYRLVERGYFFHSLYWLARAVGLLPVRRSTTILAPTYPGPHAIFGRLLQLEQRLLPISLRGSSLFAILAR